VEDNNSCWKWWKILHLGQ